MMQKKLKMTETLANGYSSDSIGESYPMNTNMKGFRCFSKIVAFLSYGHEYPQHWKGTSAKEESTAFIQRIQLSMQVNPYAAGG